MLAQHGAKTDADAVDFFLDLFLQGDVPAAAREKLLDYLEDREEREVPGLLDRTTTSTNHRTRAVAHLVLTLPEFQLN